jgi:hypothetical protein
MEWPPEEEPRLAGAVGHCLYNALPLVRTAIVLRLPPNAEWSRVTIFI